MIAEAIDTALTVGYALAGWVIFFATIAAILALAAIATGAWGVRAVWRRSVGPSWARGRLENNRDPARPAVAAIVDDLVTLASVFGLRPEQLLTAPGCFVCMDKPPTGFVCRTCGAEA